MLIFIIYANKKEKVKILSLFTLVLSIFAVVVFVSLFALHGHGRKLFCGLAATIFSIIMYASPLSIMVSKLELCILAYTPSLFSGCYSENWNPLMEMGIAENGD